MKRTIYSLAMIALMAGTTLTSCGTSGQKGDAAQANSNDTSNVAKGKAKLDKNKVPKTVTDLFYADYPVTKFTDYYGYPSFDYVNDWYGYDPSLYVNDYPETYVIDFAVDSTGYKAVYDKNGKKVAIHKAVSALPQTISTALSQGAYKDWAIGKDKEEIFKDKDADKLKVYKVSVTKGNESHTLYFQPDGKLLKDKKAA